jgi:hypothetical protein
VVSRRFHTETSYRNLKPNRDYVLPHSTLIYTHHWVISSYSYQPRAPLESAPRPRLEVISLSQGTSSPRVQPPAKVLFHPSICAAPSMDTPFHFLAALPAPANGLSLGEQLTQAISERPWVDSLLACFPSTAQPAILSTNLIAPSSHTHTTSRHHYEFPPSFILPEHPPRS